MPTRLSVNVIEESTVVITATYYDEDENAITPTTMKWKLTDEAGTVINEQEENELAVDTSNDVVLTGDDLVISGDDDDGHRVVTFEGTYNSAAGTGLNIKEACWFNIYNLLGV